MKLIKPLIIYHSSFIIILCFVFSSCNYYKNHYSEETVARVYDNYLYKSDIKEIITQGLSKKDSIAFVDNYVNNWIRQSLMLHNAEDNLSSEKNDVEKQLKEYRSSLLVYLYEKDYVNTKLDTVITYKQMEEYYNENKSNFELKNNIVNVVYVKVAKNTKDLDKIRNWVKTEDVREKRKLKEYCKQNAINYYLDDNTWLLFDDLLKEIPITTYNQELYLNNNRFVELQDNTGYYFVNIKGFKTKNSISPLSFEKDNIRLILENKRKLNLIKQMENEIYKQAHSHNNFEIFK